MTPFEEAEPRFRVWYALADLFLDTEPQPDNYAWIARTLNGSGFDKVELRRILAEEVGPAFVFNLFDIAGEWAGWGEDYVRQLMTAPRKPLRPAERRAIDELVEEEWPKIEALLD